MASTLNEAKKEVNECGRKMVPYDGFKPVYVKTEFRKNKFSYGVQFWSECLISQKWSRNPDGAMSIFVEFVR